MNRKKQIIDIAARIIRQRIAWNNQGIMLLVSSNKKSKYVYNIIPKKVGEMNVTTCIRNSTEIAFSERTALISVDLLKGWLEVSGIDIEKLTITLFQYSTGGKESLLFDAEKYITNVPMMDGKYKLKEPGIYLRLYHGFVSGDERSEVGDWGDEGPIIGPLFYVHTTYMSTVGILFKNKKDANRYGFEEEEVLLDLHDDCICWNYMEYGDWVVFENQEELPVKQPKEESYDVAVCKTSYGYANAKVKASSPEEAEEKALANAKNYLYDVKYVDYSLVPNIVIEMEE